MLHKHCTGRISANIKPHQLCWIDQELVLSKRYSSHMHEQLYIHSVFTSFTPTPTNLGFSPLQAPPPAPPPFPSDRTLLLSTIAPHSCHLHLQEEHTSATGLLPPLPSPPPSLLLLLPPSPSSGLLLLRDCCFFMDLCSSWYLFSYTSPRSAACSSSS